MKMGFVYRARLPRRIDSIPLALHYRDDNFPNLVGQDDPEFDRLHIFHILDRDFGPHAPHWVELHESAPQVRSAVSPR